MSKLHFLKSIQKIPADMETTWGFFSNPRNLLKLTPLSLNLDPVNEIHGEKAYAGQVMIYQVKPLLGIPVEWMTEIKNVIPHQMFIDEQRKGPYKLWHHQHHFKAIEGGVEMTDLVHYRVPFGFIGDLAHPLVKRKLTEIFTFRFQKINEIFGPWEHQKMNLEIE